MHASGDFGDVSDFTISSVNDGDISDTGSIYNTFKPTQKDKATEFQLLKIGLSKKSMELEKCKKAHSQREQELQDKIESVMYQRDAIQHQLEYEIQKHQEETLRKQNEIKYQLEQAAVHQNYLENTNEKLVQSTLTLKDVLSENLRIDDHKYLDLTSKSEFELSFKELIQVRIYDMVKPLLQEIINLKQFNKELSFEYGANKNDLESLTSSLKEEQDNKLQLQKEFNKNLIELSDLRDKVKIGNYKIENFDAIKKNCDTFEEKYNSTVVELSKMKANFSGMEKERDQMMKAHMDLNQSYRLTIMDKEYLTKQVNELNCRCNNAEDRLQMAWKQLEESKISREQLYEKYVVARDEFRAQYENRLKEELDCLRLKTEHEMEKIKISTKELFERENKSLSDQKESAVADRDLAARNLREVEDRLEKIKFEYSTYQSGSESKISELINEIKMKSFEFERNNILYDEACNKLKITSLELEKYQAKFEILTKEYYQIESNSSKRISELEMKLEETTKKVHSYERLEEELDLAIMHAAENNGAQPVLMWPHGYDSGNPLPTQAGRRMQHSIELARRVLYLERMLKDKNEKLESQTKELQNLQRDFNASESVLKEAQQPYSYMIESLKKKDAEIVRLKAVVKDLTNEMNEIRQEKMKIAKEKNRMARDLEQLFSQKEEFLKLRKIVEELKNENPTKNTVISVNKLPKNDPINTYQLYPGRAGSGARSARNQEYAISRS